MLQQARSGAPEGLVATAEHQTAGRGRLGRRWMAPAGSSLMCSILLRPVDLASERRHLLTVAVALAAADACAAVAGIRPGLKWPNDLVVDDRKLAGELAEAEDEAVVVGIGVNVLWPDELPEEIATTATALSHLGAPSVDRGELLDALLSGLAMRYPNLDVAEEYRASCVTIGRQVRVDIGSEVIEGVATDVDADGALILDGARRILAGDVVHLR